MKKCAVSEIIGTLVLVGVVVVGIALVGIFLLSNPTPSKVPAFNALISNESRAIYIYHKGGDSVRMGEIHILVDGVDRTSSFVNNGDDPWSVGETLSNTSPTMPRKVVILFTGDGRGGASVLMGSDLQPALNVPLHLPLAPVVDWDRSPYFGNITTPFQFTDTSYGPQNITYFWNFNDASTSTEKSPAHTFPCTGDSCVYSINHSVTDSPGTLWEAVTWLNRSSWVTVYKNLTPTVTFTENKTFGPIGCSAIKFNATQAGVIRVDNWSWTFGDGGTSYVEDPTYTYSTQGTYTVALTATNFTLGTTTVTKNNLVLVPPNPWYSCSWIYRKNITLNRTAVPADLTNFPVLINYIDSDLKAGAKAKGDDILFTTSDGTKIPYQIESFMKNTGSITAWVRVPALSSTANTTIFMYYGNPAATWQENAVNVWDSNYKGVYHLNESTGDNPMDSTSNHNNGNQQNSPVQTPGQINGSLKFDGSSDYVNMGNEADFNFGSNPFTVSTWVKGGAADEQVLGKSNWAGTDNGIQIYTAPAGDYYLTAPQGTIGITGTGGTGYPTSYATNNSVYGTAWGINGYAHFYKQTGTLTGTATGITIYVSAQGSSSPTMRLALYDHNAGTGKPGSLLAETAATAVGSAGSWQTVSFQTPVNVNGLTTWWIGIQQRRSDTKFRTDTTGTNYYGNYSYAYNTFPNPSGLATLSNGRDVVSARVVYVQVKGFAKATKATLSTSNAFIESMSFYSHATGNVRLAIYSDSSAAPNSKLWESNSIAATSGGWKTINIASGTPTSLTLASGTYWLAWQWDSTNAGPSYTAGSSGDGYYRVWTYGSFPSSFGGTSSSEKWSLYGSYGIKIGPDDGILHYLTVTRTGANQLTTYYDGNLVGSATDARTLSNTDNFYLATAAGSNNFDNILDEVRLSSGVARDANWILTEYRNQANPALFHYNMTQEALT